jgi:hypothetical protein
MRVVFESFAKFYWEEDDIRVGNGYIYEGESISIIYNSADGDWALFNRNWEFAFYFCSTREGLAEYINDIGNGDLAPFNW